MGFELIIEFIEHLIVVATRNYNAIANSHILQLTTVFSVCRALTSRCLETDPNNFLCFHAHVFTGWCLSITRSLLQLTNPQACDHLTPTCYSSHCRFKTLNSRVIAAAPRFMASTRTAQKTPLTAVILLLLECVLRPLPSNGRCLQSH
jgi:hypothetical protein